MSRKAGRNSLSRVVRITVSGGVIQAVSVPKGIRVIVKDYDVEGCTKRLSRDRDGDQYMRCVYEKE